MKPTNDKLILDACCGSRMFWFDKENPLALFADIREEEHVLCDGRKLSIAPDVVATSTYQYGGGVKERKTLTLRGMAQGGLLPTPQARDWRSGSGTEDVRTRRKLERGWTMDLNDLGACGLLPTPTAASDAKGGCTQKEPRRQNDTLAHAIHGKVGTPGRTSRLNPLFVAQMMGFPVSWTVSPFLPGAGNPSSPTETR